MRPAGGAIIPVHDGILPNDLIFSKIYSANSLGQTMASDEESVSGMTSAIDQWFHGKGGPGYLC